MLDIDTAIKHCLEVAKKNDGEAEVYDLLAKNHNNPYEKLTASKFYTDCAECAADHRQLAEWLTELKEAKRLLKAAAEHINDVGACETCEYYPAVNSDMCQKDNCYKWCYADEAEKLLNDEK